MIEVNKKLENGVSVVIPFYNRSKFLKRLLDSIEIQTLPPEKIFIVDNGSSLEETNTAWNLIQSHALFAKCSFLSTMKSGNANYARNLGYELSETKYVAFLDSDDWWKKDHLSQSIQCLKNSNKVAVYSGAIVHSSKSIIINKSIDVNFFDNPFSLILSDSGYLAQTSSYVIDKSQLKHNVIWDESLKRHQDFDYFAAIFYRTSGWCYCPEVNVNIDWKHTDNSKKNIDFISIINFYEKWRDKVPESVKKFYLLEMLYLSYKSKQKNKMKEFYHNELNHYGFSNDWKYRIISHKFYIVFYINFSKGLDRIGLKSIFRKIIFNS